MFKVLRSLCGLIHNKSGSTMVLIAVTLPLLVSVMAVTVDLTRVYVAQTKVQTALDTALTGAVAAGGTLPTVSAETTRLFNANFPVGYMGVTLTGIAVSQPSSGVFNATVTARVPTTVLGMGSGSLTTLSILSQVTSGYQTSSQKSLEMAIVIDNSASFSTTERGSVRTSAYNMVNTIFGTAVTLSNVHVSVVHYNNMVNIGAGRSSWIQPTHRTLYTLLSTFLGLGPASNRNSDSPPNTMSDFSNAAPTVASALFRIPRSASTFTSQTDSLSLSPRLGVISFAQNNKNTIRTAIDTSINSRGTRTNVGLMWGWFTLSPTWRGIWSASIPTKPANFGPLMNKSMVLITGGKNNVFLGVSGTSDDNKSTALLCSAIKAQGITLYVVGYDSSPSNLDETQLSSCASRPNFYFYAANSTDLNTMLLKIAGDISFNTLRLSQ
jgi:Flp pilus assembly protein TadG